MLNDNIPSVEIARARHESCQEKTKATRGDVELAAGNRSHSAGKLTALRPNLASSKQKLANATKCAVEAVGTPNAELVAATVSELRMAIELTELAVAKTRVELTEDEIQTAEYSMAEAQAGADEADANVILQQAIQQEAFAKFSEAVEGGVGCIGVSGIVRRAMEESISATKRLADRKEELVSIKEFNHVSI